MFDRLRRLLGGRDTPRFTTTPGAEPASGPLLRMEGVTRTFLVDRVETHALRGIDLEVERGEFVAVNGPSGSGKSTLLSIAGLMDRATSGRYLLNGADVATLGARTLAATRNRELGFIFQSFNLIGDLTVFENVELPLTYQGLPAAERRDRVDAALERFELADRAHQMPGQLSGGHQQRVAVARAVVGNPAVLMADEPTGNLNSEQAETVIEMLQELHRGGSTILLVTHDPRWASVVERSVELFDGRLV
jgi:putative ABC transport system ATP-binding protein